MTDYGGLWWIMADYGGLWRIMAILNGKATELIHAWTRGDDRNKVDYDRL